MGTDDQLDRVIAALLKFCGRAWTFARFSLLVAVGVYLVYIFVDIRSNQTNMTTFTVMDIASRIASDVSSFCSNIRVFHSLANVFGNLASLGEQSPSLFLFLLSTLTTVAVLFCLCG
jgi:hypothetical protein